MPDFEHEDLYAGPVCGLDEVGRGPLAGPVVAACVYIPPAARAEDLISQIRDSKKLSPRKLFALYDLITAHFEWAVAEVSPGEIDRINILQASLKAMRLAMNATGRTYTHVLVDGNKIPPDLQYPATALVKGDNRSVSIAAASIVAKVTRDRLMHVLHLEYPFYGWDSNVGYPAKAHLEGIAAHGLTPHHRRSFGPVRDYETQRLEKTA